jgi:hypothetical protein
MADFGELTPKLAEPHDRIRTKAAINDQQSRRSLG